MPHIIEASYLFFSPGPHFIRYYKHVPNLIPKSHIESYNDFCARL